MKLFEVLQKIKPNITSGSQFLWKCYGNNAWMIDLCRIDTKLHMNETVTIIYDSQHMEIYEISTYSEIHQLEYKWYNPNYREIVKEEYKNRNIDFDDPICEDIKLIELEMLDDIIEKSSAIIEGKDFDKRILVELNLTNEEIETLTRASVLSNQTIDEFVNSALIQIINEK